MAQRAAAVLGLRIHQELQRQKVSIPQLAKASAVPLSAVQKICKGDGKQPSVWTVKAIARALHVSMGYLCGEDLP
jgi:transcriptional regulator with XRE-family HTH domain